MPRGRSSCLTDYGWENDIKLAQAWRALSSILDHHSPRRGGTTSVPHVLLVALLLLQLPCDAAAQTFCDTWECTGEWAQKAEDPGTIQCADAGCDDNQCCDKLVMCRSWTCSSGWIDAATKNSTACGTAATDCDDSLCCVSATSAPGTGSPPPGTPAPQAASPTPPSAAPTAAPSPTPTPATATPGTPSPPTATPTAAPTSPAPPQTPNPPTPNPPTTPTPPGSSTAPPTPNPTPTPPGTAPPTPNPTPTPPGTAPPTPNPTPTPPGTAPPTPTPPATPATAPPTPNPTSPPTPTSGTDPAISHLAVVLRSGNAAQWLQPGSAATPHYVGAVSGAEYFNLSLASVNFGTSKVMLGFASAGCASGQYELSVQVSESLAELPPAWTRRPRRGALCLGRASASVWGATGFGLAVGAAPAYVTVGTAAHGEVTLADVLTFLPRNDPILMGLNRGRMLVDVQLNVAATSPPTYFGYGSDLALYLRLSAEGCQQNPVASGNPTVRLTQYVNTVTSTTTPDAVKGLLVGTATLDLSEAFMHQSNMMGSWVACFAVGPAGTVPVAGQFHVASKLKFAFTGIRLNTQDSRQFPLYEGWDGSAQNVTVYEDLMPPLAAYVHPTTYNGATTRLQDPGMWQQGLSLVAVPAARGCASLSTVTIATMAATGAVTVDGEQHTIAVRPFSNGYGPYEVGSEYHVCAAVVRQFATRTDTGGLHFGSTTVSEGSTGLSLDPAGYRDTGFRVWSTRMSEFGEYNLRGVSSVGVDPSLFSSFGLLRGAAVSFLGELDGVSASYFSAKASSSIAQFHTVSDAADCGAAGTVVGANPVTTSDFRVAFDSLGTTASKFYVCIAVRPMNDWGLAQPHYVLLPVVLRLLPFSHLNGDVGTSGTLVVLSDRVTICYSYEACMGTGFQSYVDDAVTLRIAPVGLCPDLTATNVSTGTLQEASSGWHFAMPGIQSLPYAVSHAMCLYNPRTGLVEMLPIELERLQISVEGKTLGSHDTVKVSSLPRNLVNPPASFSLSVSTTGAQSSYPWFAVAPQGWCGYTNDTNATLAESAVVEYAPEVTTAPFTLNSCGGSQLSYELYAGTATHIPHVLCVAMGGSSVLPPDVALFEDAGLMYEVTAYPEVFVILSEPSEIRFPKSWNRPPVLSVSNGQEIVALLPSSIVIEVAVQSCPMLGVPDCIAECEQGVEVWSDVLTCTEQCEEESLGNCTADADWKTLTTSNQFVEPATYKNSNQSILIEFFPSTDLLPVQPVFRLWYRLRFKAATSVGSKIAPLSTVPMKLIGCYDWREGHWGPGRVRFNHSTTGDFFFPSAAYALPNTSTCVACPVGALCDGTTELRTQTDYWRPNTNSYSFYSCKIPIGTQSCMGNTTVGKCEAGYKQHRYDNLLALIGTPSDHLLVSDDNPLCTLCASGYGKQGNSDNLCGVCSAAWKSWLATVGGAFLIIIILMGMVLSTIRTSRELKKNELAIMVRMFISYISVASLTGNYGKLYASLFKDALSVQSKASGQVVGQVVGFDCLFPSYNYYHKFAFVMLMPLIFTLLLGFAFGPIMWIVKYYYRKKKGQREFLRQTAWFGTRPALDVGEQAAPLCPDDEGDGEGADDAAAAPPAGAGVSPKGPSRKGSRGDARVHPAHSPSKAADGKTLKSAKSDGPADNAEDGSSGAPLLNRAASEFGEMLQTTGEVLLQTATDALPDRNARSPSEHASERSSAHSNRSRRSGFGSQHSMYGNFLNMFTGRTTSKVDQKHLDIFRRLEELFDRLDRNGNELLSKFEIKAAYTQDPDIKAVVQKEFNDNSDLFWEKLLPEKDNRNGVTKEHFVVALAAFECRNKKKPITEFDPTNLFSFEKSDSEALSVIDEHEDELGAMLGFKSTELKKAYFASMVIFLVIIYPTVLETAAKFLQCDTYDWGYGDPMNMGTSPRYERTVFRHDTALSCDSKEFKAYRIAAIVLLVFYGALLPIGAMVCLKLIRGPQDVPPNESPEHRQRRKQGMKNVRMMFGFLMSGYTREAWYWEAVVMMRKSAMVFISVYVRDIMSVYAAMWTMTLCCVLQIHFKPYIHRNLNRLETFSLFTIAATLNFSLLYDPSVADFNKNSSNPAKQAGFWIVTLILMVANLSLVLYFIGWIIYYLLEFVSEVCFEQLQIINRVGARLPLVFRTWLMTSWRGEVMYVRSEATGRRRILKDGASPLLPIREQMFLGVMRSRLSNILFLRRTQVDPFGDTEEVVNDTGTPPLSPVVRRRELLQELATYKKDEKDAVLINVGSRVLLEDCGDVEGEEGGGGMGLDACPDRYHGFEVPQAIRVATPAFTEVFKDTKTDVNRLPSWTSGSHILFSSALRTWHIAEKVNGPPLFSSRAQHDDLMPHSVQHWVEGDGTLQRNSAVTLTAPPDGQLGTVVAINRLTKEARVYWDVTPSKLREAPTRTHVHPLEFLSLAAPEAGRWKFLSGTDCMFRGVSKVSTFIRWKVVVKPLHEATVGSPVRIKASVKYVNRGLSEDDPLVVGEEVYAESCKMSWPYDKRSENDQMGSLRDAFGEPPSDVPECSFDEQEEVALGMNGQYEGSTTLLAMLGPEKSLEFCYWLPDDDPTMSIEPMVYTESKVGYAGMVHDFHRREPGFQVCVRMLQDQGGGLMLKPPPPPPSVVELNRRRPKRPADGKQVVHYDQDVMDNLLGGDEHDSDDDVDEPVVDEKEHLRHLNELVAKQQAELQELQDTGLTPEALAEAHAATSALAKEYLSLLQEVGENSWRRSDVVRQQRKKEQAYQIHVKKLRGLSDDYQAHLRDAEELLVEAEQKLSVDAEKERVRVKVEALQSSRARGLRRHDRFMKTLDRRLDWAMSINNYETEVHKVKAAEDEKVKRVLGLFGAGAGAGTVPQAGRPPPVVTPRSESKSDLSKLCELLDGELGSKGGSDGGGGDVDTPSPAAAAAAAADATTPRSRAQSASPRSRVSFAEDQSVVDLLAQKDRELKAAQEEAEQARRAAAWEVSKREGVERLLEERRRAEVLTPVEAASEEEAEEEAAEEQDGFVMDACDPADADVLGESLQVLLEERRGRVRALMERTVEARALDQAAQGYKVSAQARRSKVQELMVGDAVNRLKMSRHPKPKRRASIMGMTLKVPNMHLTLPRRQSNAGAGSKRRSSSPHSNSTK